jgi:DNA-binding SARP family transcriptional activator
VVNSNGKAKEAIIEFRLLGPFDVVHAGVSIPVGGAKQRALLAILALHANEVVSVDRLIDELWGERPPESAANTVQVYVSRLRKALESNGARGSNGLIVSRPPGYSLRADPGQIDARRFERLLEEGARRLGVGDADEAAKVLADALALWRGPALADFRLSRFADSEIARLEELRLTAVEERIEADLARGEHARVVAELERVVAEHPLRERPRAQLMLALYRCGRQVEALEVYRDGRRRLVDDLGLEPGPRLQQLERAILAHDPALEAPAAARPRGPTARRPRLRRLVFAILALVLVTTAAGISLFRGGGSDAPAPFPIKAHSVAVIDPATNAVVADLEIGGWPRAITSGDGFVWAARTGDDTVVRIDPVSRLVLDHFSATTPLDVAFGDDAIWIANGNSFDSPNPPGGGTIERYDLATRRLAAIARVGPATAGNAEQTVVAAGREGVWVGNGDSSRVVRLDARTGKIASAVPETIQVAGLAVGAGAVWAADPINNVVFRIDPRTGLVVARIPVADGPRRIAVGEGAVWVIGEFPRSGVWKIDPGANRAVAHIPVRRRANGIAVGEGSVWVTSNTPGHAGPGSVTRIDPRTNEVVATVDLGFSPEGVVTMNGLVWVVVGPS